MLNYFFKGHFKRLWIFCFLFPLLFFVLSGKSPTSHPKNNSDLRIISLSPANTEILFALGLKNQIVGVTTFCDWPPEVKKYSKVGDFSSPSIEKIVSLNPDIIFATGMEQKPIVNELLNLGFKVIVIDPTNFSQLFNDIYLIGKITKQEKNAENLILEMKNEIKRIKDNSEKLAFTPRIFIEISINPLMTAAKGSFVDEMIYLAGGENIGHNLIRSYCRVNEEFLLEKDPQIIILTSQGALDYFNSSPSFKNISALKNGFVVADINPDILLRPGPRLIEGLKKIQKIIEDWNDYNKEE